MAKKDKKKAAKRTGRRGGAGKSKGRRKSGRRGGAGLSGRDVWIALGTATALAWLQGAAVREKEKDPKSEPLITKIPMISSIGRTATLAIVAYLGWRFAHVAILKPVALGLAILAIAQLARRGFKLYDEKADAMTLSGGDEWQLPAAQVAMSGDLTLDGDDSGGFGTFLDQLAAA